MPRLTKAETAKAMYKNGLKTAKKPRIYILDEAELKAMLPPERDIGRNNANGRIASIIPPKLCNRCPHPNFSHDYALNHAVCVCTSPETEPNRINKAHIAGIYEAYAAINRK